MGNDAANFKLYGSPPFNLVLLHGGPGAAGSLAPLAELLAKSCALIEAYQTRHAVKDLVSDLHALIRKKATPPVILLGHSWGAWLALLYASRYPDLCSKLLLVSSAGFENRYVPILKRNRENRISPEDKSSLAGLLQKLEMAGVDRDAVFADLAEIFRRVDAFDPREDKPGQVKFDYGLYSTVWAEAEKLRENGELLEAARGILCPVLAIHGAQDPHPAQGVQAPLEKTIRHFRFILLENCGHEPWNEKQARERFFRILENEIRQP